MAASKVLPGPSAKATTLIKDKRVFLDHVKNVGDLSQCFHWKPLFTFSSKFAVAPVIFFISLFLDYRYHN